MSFKLYQFLHTENSNNMASSLNTTQEGPEETYGGIFLGNPQPQTLQRKTTMKNQIPGTGKNKPVQATEKDKPVLVTKKDKLVPVTEKNTAVRTTEMKKPVLGTEMEPSILILDIE